VSMDPGWYPDPFSSSGYLRWWDGERWGASTSVVATAPSGQVAPMPPPPAGAPVASATQVVAPIPLATWPQRAGARIIDVLIEAVIGTPFVLWLVWPSYTRFSDSVGDGVPTSTQITELTNDIAGVTLAATLITLAISFLYEVPQNVVWGRTVGKRVLRLRIRPLADDVPLTWGQATIRWGTYAIGNALTRGLFGIVDYLWPLWDKPWRQALHDKTARTIVVPVPVLPPPPDLADGPPYSG
jgi:uncharacterized RDD family membrane protein YckC